MIPVTTPSRAHRLFGILFFAIALSVVVTALAQFAPIGLDWNTFHQAGQSLRDPFAVGGFVNPPHVLLLLPHAALPINWGNAINLILNVAVVGFIALPGGKWAVLMCYTNPLFFAMLTNNNIDWIAGLAFLIGGPMWLKWLIMSAKPHVIGGVGLVWLKRWGIRPLIPTVVVIAATFLIFGMWLSKIQLSPEAPKWNFAPFPVMIPLGVWMLWRGYTQADQELAACATPFLTPYIAPYSIALVYSLLARRDLRAAFWVWVGFWVFFVIEVRRIEFIYNALG